MNFIVAGW